MNKSLKRIALMMLFVLSVVCAAVAVAACNKDKESGKVTYTVTVTTQTGLTVTDFKAQWLAGEEPVSEEIALDTQGKASVELDAGEYTVTLKGVPDGYSFTPATVNSGNRDAAITVVQDETKTIAAITVRLPAGISYNLTAVSAQIFKDGTAVGAARALTAQGVARIPVPRDGGTYNVRLLNLPDFLGYTEPVITASNATATATINTVANDIEYTVNISCEEDIGEATVTFYNGEDAVEGATELPIVDKQVKKTLKAGNYTAELNTDDITVSSTDAQLTYTAEGRTATLNVTITKYIITLDKPANVTADFADIHVTLTKDGDVTGYSATAGENGVANVRAPLGKYGIKVTDGSGTEIGAFPVELTETVVSATVKLAVIPQGASGEDTRKVLNAEGRYYLEATFDPDNPADGAIIYPHVTTDFLLNITGDGPYYTVTWDANGAGGWFEPEYDSSVKEDVLGECTRERIGFTGAGSIEAKFKVSYVTYESFEDITVVPYMLIFQKSAEIPVRGSLKGWPADLAEGENTVDASWTEAWFKVPKEYACHKIEFSGGIEAEYVYDDDVKSPRTLESGSYFRGEDFEPGMNGDDGWLHLESESGNIKFTLIREDEAGSTPKAAIPIELNTPYEHKFIDNGNRYYTFTPEITKSYDIVDTHTSGDAPYIAVYQYDGDVWTEPYDGENEGNSDWGYVALRSGVKYLFVLQYAANGTAFKITEHTDVAGDLSMPIAVENMGNNQNTVTTHERGGKRYFYHTVKAESLDAADNVVFDFVWDSVVSSVNVYFYSDEEYTEQIAYNDMAETVTVPGRHVDEKIYFSISCQGGDSLVVYINKPVDGTLVLDQSVPIPHVDAGGTSLKIRLGLDASLTGDEYSLCWNVSPDPQSYSQLRFTVGNRTFESVGNPMMPVSGSVLINLLGSENEDGSRQRATIITVQIPGSSPNTYNWSFTLKKPILKPSQTESVTADIADLKVETEAPAGRYRLTYKLDTEGEVPITIGSFNGTATNTETTSKITIEANAPITWTNPDEVTGKITFRLEQIADIVITATDPVTAPIDKGDESLIVKLQDIVPGKYSLKIDIKDLETFTGVWTIEVGEKQFTLEGQTGLVRTFALEIPSSATEMTIKLNAAAEQSFNVELTLTQTGWLDLEKLELGEPYEIWFAADRKMVEIPIDFATEKSLYQILLNITNPTASDYRWYAEIGGQKIAINNGSLLTIIPADSKTLKIGVDDDLSKAFKITATVTKQDTMFPDTPKEVVVGELGTEFTAYFEQSGIYKITISGEDIGSVSINANDDTIVQAGETEGELTVMNPGVVQLKALGDSGKTINVTITRTGDYVPDLKLGEEAEITMTDWMVDKTIQLEVGYFKATLSGQDSAKIQVKTGFDDSVIITAGDLTGTFYIDKAQVVTLKFIDMTFEGNVNFNVKVETVDTTITVGTAKTVTIPTTGDQDINLEVALEAGKSYTITLTYSSDTILVADNSERLGDMFGTILEPGEKSGTVEVSQSDTYSLKIQDAEYVGGMEVTILIEEVQA